MYRNQLNRLMKQKMVDDSMRILTYNMYILDIFFYTLAYNMCTYWICFSTHLLTIYVQIGYVLEHTCLQYMYIFDIIILVQTCLQCMYIFDIF